MRYDSVNAGINPELKEQILDGSFGEVKCPKCGATCNLVYNFLYHDMKDKYLICVGTDYTDTMREFGKPEGYKLRYVAGIQHLVDKIHIFDAGLDDVIMELTKQWMRDKEGIDGELFFVETQDDELVFAWPDEMKGLGVSKKLYDDCKESIVDLGFREADTFFKIDMEYGKTIKAALSNC